MDEVMKLRNELTEALVGLIRTGGTNSFDLISDKDRVFFSGLAVSGDSSASAEELSEACGKVLAMRKRLTAPKCVGCDGAPDLSGEFSMDSWEDDDREVRALKFLILCGLRELAGPVSRAVGEGRTDAPLREAFYRAMFLIGTDLAEDDLIQVAYGFAELREKVLALG